MALLSRAARERYGLQGLASASATDLRDLAHRINQRRGGEPQVQAGELGALLVLQELLFAIVTDTFHRDCPEALGHALRRLDAELGPSSVDELLAAFEAEYSPPQAVAETAGKTGGDVQSPAARLTALEALLVLWQVNRNPALEPLRELFDDRRLPPDLYAPVTAILSADLRETTRGMLDDSGDLIEKLEAPARQAPGSIADQLGFYLTREKTPLLPRERIERTLDGLREERIRLPAGPGPIEVPMASDLGSPRIYGPPRPEPPWMRTAVLVAKHTYVWLDQLSREHGRAISRLDEVPDESLAQLAEWGFSGLWLVGIWKRSPASRRIKQLAGDFSAEASAYSVFDYQVAEDLGGDEALADLQARALRHGIRLGVDVVPNHIGIDSPWLRDHPERFLFVDRCPFPGYTFEGPDLSSDPDIGIFLEDHYYDRSDAAVVFRHLDRRDGRERFIYHGNDGTNTPWNDTAQLDYSQAEVRSAMTELIAALARRFSIIRFDAAMTLTRMHFQRLWFPAPGSGGAVPSRSEHGMSTERFRLSMPEEFWFGVVERINRESPDTLLVAEAFWMMEPYFVRELGMHRVYNSAFMHLLRETENARFRELLEEILGRDPEFLRRSVNFMSTPDEASAAEQFGTGDRYFGVCVLLASLPGTPLFAHGQIEGLTEQYGMEFRRARAEEARDEALIERHRREILPLLKRRDRFAETERFHLLEFVDDQGRLQSDVLALASGRGADIVLVAFNNSSRTINGTLTRARSSARVGLVDEVVDLASLLEVTPADPRRVTLWDPRTGLEIERSAARIASHGLQLELGAWQALVLQPV
jgi:glycosidase